LPWFAFTVHGGEISASNKVKTLFGNTKSWRYIKNNLFVQDPRVKGDDKTLNRESARTRLLVDQELGKLLNEFLNLPKPIGSRLRHVWLEQDEAQGAALSRFWAGMRDRHRQTLERLGADRKDIESDLKALSADSESEHILSVQNEREDILVKIRKVQNDKDLQRELERATALSLVNSWSIETK
jgi:hypothetical protein